MSAVAPVAVVGGGIAGAAACVALQGQGIAPLWIAPHVSGGDRPGEHLAPAAGAILSRLGLADLLESPSHRAANSIFSAWGSDRLAERSAIVHLEGPGVVLDRPRFEADLRARACDATAECIDARLLDIADEDGAWLLRVEGGARRARFVIDATGRTALLARRFATRFRADRLAALVAFLEQDPHSDVRPTQATLIEAAPSGWWYASLLADGRLALNFFSDPDLMPAAKDRSSALQGPLLAETLHVRRWIDEASFRFTSPLQIASAATTWVAPAAGARWLAVGDAASSFDPLSSHGMTTALWTGAAGAEAVAAAISGDGSALAAYAAKVADGVQRFLQAHVEVYRQETRFSEAPFWQRRLKRP